MTQSEQVNATITLLGLEIARREKKLSSAQIEAFWPALTPEELERQVLDKLQAGDVAIAALDRAGRIAELDRSDDAVMLSACLWLRVLRGEWSRTRAERTWRRMGGKLQMWEALRQAILQETLAAVARTHPA